MAGFGSQDRIPAVRRPAGDRLTDQIQLSPKAKEKLSELAKNSKELSEVAKQLKGSVDGQGAATRSAKLERIKEQIKQLKMELAMASDKEARALVKKLKALASQLKQLAKDAASAGGVTVPIGIGATQKVDETANRLVDALEGSESATGEAGPGVSPDEQLPPEPIPAEPGPANAALTGEPPIEKAGEKPVVAEPNVLADGQLPRISTPGGAGALGPASIDELSTENAGEKPVVTGPTIRTGVEEPTREEKRAEREKIAKAFLQIFEAQQLVHSSADPRKEELAEIKKQARELKNLSGEIQRKLKDEDGDRDLIDANDDLRQTVSTYVQPNLGEIAVSSLLGAGQTGTDSVGELTPIIQVQTYINVQNLVRDG